MRRVMGWVAIVGLAAGAAAAWADDKPATKTKPTDTTMKMTMQPYMGVELAPLPPAIWSQMPGVVPRGQGVLLMYVDKGGPADKAGLKPDDILLGFGDQKLYSPEQFIKLVHGNKPGHEVAVDLVRGGKAVAFKITLGERDVARTSRRPVTVPWPIGERFRELFGNGAFPAPGNVKELESFDAINLTRLDGDRWRAKIEYRTNEGKKESKTFEGTREEIRKDINAEKNLPAEERDQLIRVLKFHEPVFEWPFPWID